MYSGIHLEHIYHIYGIYSEIVSIHVYRFRYTIYIQRNIHIHIFSNGTYSDILRYIFRYIHSEYIHSEIHIFTHIYGIYSEI